MLSMQMISHPCFAANTNGSMRSIRKIFREKCNKSLAYAQMSASIYGGPPPPPGIAKRLVRNPHADRAKSAVLLSARHPSETAHAQLHPGTAMGQTVTYFVDRQPALLGNGWIARVNALFSMRFFNFITNIFCKIRQNWFAILRNGDILLKI